MSSVQSCYEITLKSRARLFFLLRFFSLVFFNYLIYSLHTNFSFFLSNVDDFMTCLVVLGFFSLLSWERLLVGFLSCSHRRAETTKLGSLKNFFHQLFSSVYFALIRHTVLWILERWENNDTHEDDINYTYRCRSNSISSFFIVGASELPSFCASSFEEKFCFDYWNSLWVDEGKKIWPKLLFFVFRQMAIWNMLDDVESVANLKRWLRKL